MPREVELKSVVDDVALRRRRLEAAGARVVFDGGLDDYRYDTADRRLGASDEMLRLRVARDIAGEQAVLEWKGPTRLTDGYKVRDEIAANVTDAGPMASILEKLGYTVNVQIERRVVQYALGGATIRFEDYPRMDTLVEVEGAPDEIERAISALGMDRAGFTADRLTAFMARFEDRTGLAAAVNRKQLGDPSNQVDRG
jgi:predicted adenylyl cyclase CyaB